MGNGISPKGQLAPLIAEVLADLELLERSERIEYLISLADRFVEVPERVATRPWPLEARVPQCESEAYVFASPRADGALDFHFAVDNPQGLSAKAFAVLLAEGLSGRPLEEVLQVPGDLPQRVFGRELSMGKDLGLGGMVRLVQANARRQLGSRPG